MNKITVIHHSADFDGIFCREIARQFFEKHYPGMAEYIGWDYGDPVPVVPEENALYMLDISVEGLMDHPRLNWVDHHKSAIEKYPATIQGYRIDGVAACRLAYQYFGGINSWTESDKPTKKDFVERRVTEPLAVTLAGEYDIWDKHDERADILQFGLRSQELTEEDWAQLLSLNKLPTISELESLIDAGEKDILAPDGSAPPIILIQLLRNGKLLQKYQQRIDSGMMQRSFMSEFEGLNFLCANLLRCNSLTFASRDVPETGHDALLAFYYGGSEWTVSLYHASHRKDIDLSLIAVKYGGGGHRGACGFRSKEFPL